MTNGEKMLNVFCDSKALELGGNVSFRDGDWAIMFPDEWWHTEYKEPTTKNDLGVEYISRSELMAILSDYYDTTVEYRSMLKEIAALPPVTPQEPKTGHWIFVGEENEEETRNGNFRYICSKCGYSDVHAKSTEVPYCWHCGAKMVDPQESEEP